MTEFFARVDVATTADPSGEYACRVMQKLYWPEVTETKKGEERHVVTADNLRAAQLACAQCVIFEVCFERERKGMGYSVVAGVNTGTTTARQRPQIERVLELRAEYLESLKPNKQPVE